MKFFILFACAVAAASASHVEPIGHVYHGPQHLPIINHEGVPVDTAEVQHARAAHLAHKINVHARNGDYDVHHAVAPIVTPIVGHSTIVAHEAPIVAHSAIVAHEAQIVSHEAPLVAHSSIVAHPSPIVAHEAQILTHEAPILAQSIAAHETSVVSHSSFVAHPTPILAPLLASHSAYVSHEAPIVSYADASGWSHDGLLYRKRRGIYAAPLAYHYGYHGPQHLPIINHEGVPVDTAEVQHARAAHLIQKANVHARNGDYTVHAVAPIVAETSYSHVAPLVATSYAHGSIVAHNSYAAPWGHYY